MVRQVTLKSPSVPQVGEKWSKSQVFCSSGKPNLWDEDFGIPSRKSTLLDKEVGLSASRTGMKAMSVFELCPWCHYNEDTGWSAGTTFFSREQAKKICGSATRGVLLIPHHVKHLGLSLETKAPWLYPCDILNVFKKRSICWDAILVSQGPQM